MIQNATSAASASDLSARSPGAAASPGDLIGLSTDRLAAVPLDVFRDFATSRRSRDLHENLLHTLPTMNAVEVAGSPSALAPLAFPFTVAAWNLERCLFPKESAAHIAATGACVVLLSEMDDGMARTAQRHTTAEVAQDLSMQYAYGVEFIELGLGSEIEKRVFCRDDFNARGLHGNALLSAAPLLRPFLIRLWGERIWLNHDPDQLRIGERCAVGAVVQTEAGPFVAVSVHLESAATAAYRERQMRELIDAVEAAFPTLPILIGGDLNTGNHAEGDFEAEGLFVMSAARGFIRHSGTLEQMTTRPSLITRWPHRAMKLDWFLSRGLDIPQSAIIPSLDPNGRPLSDHDLITCRVAGFLAA
jgi:endonuclease/exonuclease/phosphatase family metal-dependent hydrolase